MQAIWLETRRRETDMYTPDAFLDTFFETDSGTLRSVFSIIYINDRAFNKFWHKWVVQHDRQVLFWKAFLSRGVGGMSPEKFWNPRLPQMHLPAFWGLYLFCFVLKSQLIWTSLEEKNWTSTQIDSRTMHYLSTGKKRTWYQSLTTESWPFQCPQLRLGRIVIVRSLLFLGWSKTF